MKKELAIVLIMAGSLGAMQQATEYVFPALRPESVGIRKSSPHAAWSTGPTRLHDDLGRCYSLDDALARELVKRKNAAKK